MHQTRFLGVFGLCGLAPTATLAAVVKPAIGLERRLLHEEIDKRGWSPNDTCVSEESAPATTAPKANIWSAITPEDNAAVWDLLHDPATGLNLTAPGDAVLTDNYVYWIDTVPVNKSDALPYIDGDGPMPPKYARAIIFEGGKEPPISQEYMVGPLPVCEETTVAPLDYIYNGGMGGAVPFNGRHFDSKRSAATEPLITEVMSSIADITVAMFNGAYYGSDDDRTNLTTTSGTPLSFDGTQAFRNIMFRYPGEPHGTASYMIPLDFYILIDCTGTDASKYFLKGIVTGEMFYPSVDEFRAAYDSGEVAFAFQQTRDDNWAMVDYKPELGERELEERFSPSSLELDGKRYKIDPEARYVEYMGWSFYVHFTRSLGIMFYDIKFKGERILYELSLQEAVAQYAGNQPKAANTVYHDTYYDLGTYMTSMVEGFDCPFGATFWDVSYYEENLKVSNPDAVCIFETDMTHPLSRHRAGGGSTDYDFQNMGVVKGSFLGVRAIATVGNYDYAFTYQFHLDGTLQVEVRASGYLQSSYYYPDQQAWGPRIYQATMGSLHDHVLTWKADFDIVDTANSLQVSELKAVNQSQPWFPELGEFEQLQLDISYMEEEKQFNWFPNQQGMYVVVNKDALNQWGEYRGYRLVPGMSDIHLSVLNSPFSLKQNEFSKSHLAISQHHDTEVFANSVQNANLPWKPQQDFSMFFDGESVEQEDIVLWFNLGMHHFTRSEDVPVTLFTEAHSSILLAPQNFFDRAQDGDLKNRRWLVPDEDTGELMVETYGIELPQCPVILEEPADALGTNTETEY
ncbi:copper amine oxidase [Lineolata rhizophorae]|uniref:Amine oxidase n=1 Tax=Lineolata rhizophorae TaxID=578093 RepID=A0A6A6PB63_9PEZI|nr:copper amine oxidase [Lineolata rhizophorae]